MSLAPVSSPVSPAPGSCVPFLVLPSVLDPASMQPRPLCESLPVLEAHRGTSSVSPAEFDVSKHIASVPVFKESEVDTNFSVCMHCCHSAVELDHLVFIITVQDCGDNSRSIFCSNIKTEFE